MATPGKPASTTTRQALLGGPASVVETACPLDCPDACSLAVTVQHGRVIGIDGSHKNPVTDGYICAKVRKFDQRVYGPDRILHPAVRKGRKGEGRFKRVPWDEALELVVSKFKSAKAAHGGESILPYSYGGSNGLLTQDNIDAQLWRRFGTSRLARTVCAAPTGAANMALYGKMPSVTYEDYPHARLIILWGVNPSASGIHLIPFVREAQKRGAKLVVVDRRQVRRARRRLFDEHLRVVEHRSHVDRRARAGQPHREHESSGPCADRVRRSAGRRAVRLQLQSRRHGARPAPRRPRPGAR